MAHKVHPKVFRLGRTEDWVSRWFVKKNYNKVLKEDFEIRSFLEERLGQASVENIEIERLPGKLTIIINSARPGLIIGRGGVGIEALKKDLEKIVKSVKDIHLEVREIKNPWESAVLCAEFIASQIEKRAVPRRVLKQALSKIMANKTVKGARVEVSGRLGGAEIARREWLSKGRLPRQTLRAEIDYGFKTAQTRYGTIGVKVWIYKGEKFD